MKDLYRGMNRAALDAAYNNQNHDTDFPKTFSNFQQRSARTYESALCRRDLRYGAAARHRYDWFPAASPIGTLIFLHGGYWQRSEKEDFAFIAAGPLQCGFNVVMAEYTLAPHATLTQIVDEISALLDCLAKDKEGTGIGAWPVCLSGHSAGGHLTAMHRAHPLVTFAMPISALVDLEPISLCYLNAKLNLTSSEIETYSPIRHIGRGAPMIVTVGAAELPELVRHSKEYADACHGAGEAVTYLPIEGYRHFSVLEDLAMPNGAMMNALSVAMKQGERADG